MSDTRNSKYYIQKTARVLMKVILFLLLFVVVIFLLLLTPPVQKFATRKVANYLENKLDTKVEIGRLGLRLPNKLFLNDVYVEDQNQDTLISGGQIKVNIDFLKLLSNEVEISQLEFTDITAKIKRVLPDTVFNFQFIVDAFATEQHKDPSAEPSPPLKLAVYKLDLNNVHFIYDDVITGNDLYARVGAAHVRIDTLNLYDAHYDIPIIEIRDVTARFTQRVPLVQALTGVEVTNPMRLKLGQANLNNIDLQFSNIISDFHMKFNVGELAMENERFDLINNVLHINELRLNQTLAAIRIGANPDTRTYTEEVKKAVEEEATKPWRIRAKRVRFNNNNIAFDNENNPRQNYGMDYSHLHAENFNLHINDFVLNKDSIGGLITKGSFREKSGFVLNALEGDVLYAHNQSYLRNLYLRTPGTDLKRNIHLSYRSVDDLVNNFERTHMDVNIINSRVQVKDILTFAPNLRREPAFSNPNDIWNLHLIGFGNMNELTLSDLKFNGFSNTQIDVAGTLTNLTNPDAAGGDLNIRRLHTTQRDIALFAGDALKSQDFNLPQSLTLTGTIRGNAGRFNTNVDIATTSGNLAVNGVFANLANPSRATYDATVRARGLQLGYLLRQPDLGVMTGTVTMNGRGFDPQTMNTRARGNISSFGYNNYTYNNITLNATFNNAAFTVDANINDPNANLRANIQGNLSGTPSLYVDAFVDSIKLHALNFTEDVFVFRGNILAEIPSLDPDNPHADILITDALMVANGDRLPIDTMQLAAGRDERGQYLTLESEVANASIVGNYRLMDLGAIIQQTIQPYFSTTPQTAPAYRGQYDFTFSIDIAHSPVISALIPNVELNAPLHAEGRVQTDTGLHATIITDDIVVSGNRLRGLNFNVNTTPEGLKVDGSISRLTGGAIDLQRTQVTATILNNEIDFTVASNDQQDRLVYRLSGLVTQPAAGTTAIHLKPEGLMLNYEEWNVNAGNRIVIGTSNISAENFVLSRGGQQLRIEGDAGAGSPLQLTFTDFRIGTITGFLQSDTLVADGRMNGTVTFPNIMEQPVFTSDLTITDFSVKGDTLGNINAQVRSTADNRYITDIRLTGRGNDVTITGTMTQRADDVALNLDLDVRTLQLNSITGVLSGVITEASGTMHGTVSIRGTTDDPQVLGEMGFDNAVVTTTMLGGPFRIDDRGLAVTSEGIRFDNFTIRDSANNALTLHGAIETTNFTNFNFNVRVSADNFRALNIAQQRNSLYYGQLYLTTELHVRGTESSPVVDGAVNINDGTKLTIVVPQQEPGVAQREGVIEFVNMSDPGIDTLFRRYDTTFNQARLVGYEVNTNITIDKAAILNIVIDEANGDFVNVKGEGLLNAGIDQSGKVTLTGSYILEEGFYELSYNFIRRRFDIERGSQIIWLGEPTRAELDVTAVYVANTPPLDLVSHLIGESNVALRNTYLQRLPFEVHLMLGGELMKPEITFDIQLPPERNYLVSSRIIQDVNSRLLQLRQQPSELNKQVFALLLLNRFVGENPFESSGDGFRAGAFARQSVSKLLTEQLNQLAAGLIEGVDITFDITSQDDYTTGERRDRTDLDVGVSKRLLNDRLTISVGSNFELEGPQQGSGANNLAGNVAVNYQLSRDGRYMVRFHRRNQYEGALEGYIIETGLSFIITFDYNRFREIIRRKETRVAGDDAAQNN